MGTATVKSRATDDSGNIETPGAGVSVTVNGATCPCSVWTPSALPAVADGGDSSVTELGLRFRADVNGWIQGVRFLQERGE
jgi:hypothetical protein